MSPVRVTVNIIFTLPLSPSTTEESLMLMEASPKAEALGTFRRDSSTSTMNRLLAHCRKVNTRLDGGMHGSMESCTPFFGSVVALLSQQNQKTNIAKIL
jgi:hypothetical protein